MKGFTGGSIFFKNKITITIAKAVMMMKMGIIAQIMGWFKLYMKITIERIAKPIITVLINIIAAKM